MWFLPFRKPYSDVFVFVCVFFPLAQSAAIHTLRMAVVSHLLTVSPMSYSATNPLK